MSRGDRTLIVVATVLILVAVLGRPIIGWMLGPIGLEPGMVWGRGAFRPGFDWTGPMGLAMGLGWLTMLAFWGGLIAAGVLLARALSRSRPAPSTPDDAQAESPVDILKRRYAAGEITEAQYTEMRQVLER